MDFKKYFQELKRRNVFKAALAYLVVAWLIVQVASIIFPAFKASPEILRSLILILILGFPVWLVFAWVYEMTPEGLKKTKKVDRQKSITSETSQKFNKIIIGALAVAIILLGANLYSNYSGVSSKSVNKVPVVDEKISATPEKDEKSVAVLAFSDMSPEKDQEYFSHGISEEILNLLAKNPELKVMSRTSAFYFKDKEVTIEEIGEKLNVNYLLEGSVRKAGDMVRITAQLINISDGSHIWSETYDRKLNDIFKVQDEIAEAVTQKLEVSILGERSKEVDPEAYALYLKAKHLFDQSNNESLSKALINLKKANSIDSTYAPIWGLMSEIYYIQGFAMVYFSREEAYELGSYAASKAIEIDPKYAKGYLQLAQLFRTRFEFVKAKNYVEKAVQLEPENPEILRKKGLYSYDSIENQIQDNKKALELDPLLYAIHYNLALMYFWNENNDEALKQINIYEEYQPESSGVSNIKAQILLQLGRTEEAIEEIDKERDAFWKMYGKIKVLYQADEQEKASQLLHDFIKIYPLEPANIADVYAFMGEREKTFEWLQRALEAKDPTITEAVYYPAFRKFHDDSRWQQLLEDMGVPEENGIPKYKG